MSQSTVLRETTEIAPNVKAKTLQNIIRGKVIPDSVVMTDGWQSYDGLVDVRYDKHARIKKYRKEGNPFTDGPFQVNGIESFWHTPKDASRALMASKQTSNSTSRNANGDGAKTLIRSLANSRNYWSRAIGKNAPDYSGAAELRGVCSHKSMQHLPVT